MRKSNLKQINNNNNKKRQDTEFNVEEWSNEELELFEYQYKESIDILVELFPNKNRAELLRAQKDRLNRDLILHQEKWTEEEINILKENFRTLTYKELVKLLPSRSVWSIMNLTHKLGLCKRPKGSKWRTLTDDELKVLGELKQNNVKGAEIAKILDISYAHLNQVLYRPTRDTRILNFRNQYLSQSNARPTNKWWTKEECDLLRTLVDNQVTLEEIAKKFGVSIGAIRSRANREGISLRNINTKSKTKTLSTLQELQKQVKQSKKELKLLNKEKELLLNEINQVTPSNTSLIDVSNIEYDEGSIADEIMKYLESISPKYEDREECLHYRMRFGKYRDKTLAYIKKNDSDYMKWLAKRSLDTVLMLMAALGEDIEL